MIEQALDIAISALVWSLPLALALMAAERLNHMINRQQSPTIVHWANRAFLGLAVVGLAALTAFFGFSIKSWQITLGADPVKGAASGVTIPQQAAELSAVGYALLALWLLVFAIKLTRLALSAMRGGELVEQMLASGKTYDGTREVYLSDAVAEPVTVGIWRQAIVLPNTRASSMAEAEIEAVIAHEQAHIDRADPIKNLLLQLLRCLFWFNWPLIHLIQAYERSREFDCDKRAVASGVEPVSLGKALGRLALPERSGPIGLALTGHYSDVASRIKALTQPRAITWPSPTVTVLILGMIVASLLWVFQSMLTKEVNVGFVCDAPPILAV